MATDFAPIRLAEETDFSIGTLRVRPASRAIQVGDGSEQTIEPRVMQLLVTLAGNAGAVVSREQLIAACWDGRVVSDDAVNSCVAKARRIGEAHQAFSIETIPRVGYRLWTRAAAPGRPMKATRARTRLLVALSAGVVAVATGWWTIGMGPAQTTPSRFAVMPVSLIDDRPATRAIANGLTEEVAAALNGYYLTAEIHDDQDFAEERRSAASHGIRLSVYFEDDRLRLLASVEDLSGGGLLWSQEFTGSASETHPLKREIAARIAVVADMVASLRSAGLDSSESETLAMVIASYDRFFTIDQRYIEDIVALLERVTRNAPDFAPGYAMYGNMLLASSLNLPGDEFPARREQARLALERARRLDPDNPQLNVGLAALTHGTEWSEREAIFRKAFSTTSGNTTSSLVYGRFLLTAGYLEEGLREQRRALGLDRFGQGPTWWIATSLYLNGLTEEALEWLEDFLKLQPAHVNARRARFMITALERPPGEARALLADPDARPLDMDDRLEAIFDAYLMARETGHPADRRTAVDMISSRWPDYVPGSGGILLASRLGDLDAAFELARDYGNDPRTTRESFHFIPFFLFGPATEAMRQDERFIPLMEQLGLLDYWRATDKWPDFCVKESQSVCSQMRANQMQHDPHSH